VLGVGDSDGLGVGCAIANDIELKSIIVAAVANLMMSPYADLAWVSSH
jgi:hypothetical protein